MKPIIVALLTFSFIGFISFSVDHGEKLGVEQTQSTMNDYGKIVWYNLVTPNIEESKQFYGSIFDWSFQDINLKGQKFVIIKYKSNPIGSMLELPNADASIWLASVSVGNVKNMVKKYKANGGRLLIDSFNVNRIGDQVILEGPSGEKMAYINNPASPISLIDNGPNQWIWAELWSTNVDTSKAFYEKVWNIKAKVSKVKGRPYWYFEKDSEKVVGMITNPVQDASTQWVPYVNMANIANLNKKLEALEANIMLAPDDTDFDSIVIFQDPHGATLCAQNYSN